MPEITANTTDGFQSSGIQPHSSGWNAAHDGAGQGNPSTTQANNAFFGPRAASSAFRGGIYFLVRDFFDFDVSGISGTVTEARFSAKTRSNGGNDAIILKSGHDPSNTSTSWFTTWLTGLGGTISGWSNSDSQVVAFSSNTTIASDGNFTNYDFNAAGLSYLNSIAGTSTLFKIVLMNYDIDYLDVDPQPSNTSQISGIYFANDTTAGNRPHLEYAVSAAGYGNAVMGVASGDITAVNGIATANIAKINGVD